MDDRREGEPPVLENMDDPVEPGVSQTGPPDLSLIRQGMSRPPSRSQSVSSSSASTASTVRKKIIDLEAEKKKLALQMEMKQVEIDAEIAKDEIDNEQELGDEYEEWSDHGSSHSPQPIPRPSTIKSRTEFQLAPPKFTSTPAFPLNRPEPSNIPAGTQNSMAPGATQNTMNPETTAIIQILQQSLMNQTEMQMHMVNASRDQTQAIIQQGEAMKTLRNPKDLPKFDGKLEDWPRFIADFRESTRIRKISDIDNLNRLQKALTGKALDAVRAQLTHPSNIPDVMKTLELLFGQPVRIIEKLIENVHVLKRIEDKNAVQIVEFSTVVRNLATTIKSFNKLAYLYNPQLINEILEKLPVVFQNEWLRICKSKDNLTIMDLSLFLTEKAEEWAIMPGPKPVKPNQTEANKDKDKPKKPETKKEKVNAAVDKPKDPCQHCEKPNHEITNCYAFKKLNVNERNKFIKDNGLCYNCLTGKHMCGDCPDLEPKCDCGKKHHKLLHRDSKPKQKKSTASKDSEDVREKSVVEGAVGAIGGSVGAVMLKVVPVELLGPKRKLHNYAFLDDGATISLIDAKVAKELGLRGPKCQLQVDWIDNKPLTVSSQRVTLEIKGKNQGESYTLKDLCTFPNLDLLTQTMDVNKLKMEFPDLDLDQVSEYKDAKPMILIGQDNAFLSQSPECEVGGQPIVTKTRLGSVVHGPVGATSGGGGRVCNIQVFHSPKEDQMLHELVKQHFSTEDFGVKVPVRAIQSKENERAVSIMQRTTRRTEGGWETGLLWRTDDPVLPNNRELALNRLKSIERNLDRDPEFAAKYTAKMEENFTKGFARELQEEELERKTGVWYHPHFNAHNMKKPDKVRIVFDAAAKWKGVSLNDHLLKGPDLYNPLPEILMKFRQHRYGLSGDIKDFFPSIKIRQEDLQYQRFLYRGMDRVKPPQEFIMDVMMFGASCSPSSAQFVRNKNAEEYAEAFPEAVQAIKEKFFMDDYLDSGPEEEALATKLKQVIDICSKGNFKLCNIVSSSEEVLRSVPESFRATEQKFTLTDSYTERVLGLYWNPKLDTFTFTTNFVKVDPEIVAGTRSPTKRDILKLVMSIFDPLGFISHFTAKAKILQQDVWRSGIGWDDEIQQNLLPRWNRWLEELRTICDVSIPRCMDPEITDARSIQLHTFVDASEQAFSAVIYLRVEHGENVVVSLVMSKSRVAPLRPLSIPRLELQAALLGSRLSTSIVDTLDLTIDDKFYWSDSRTVICWLRSDARRFQPFVAHRVGEIEELTNGGNWNWIPTKENVADEATRDSIPSDFTPSSRWFNGPEFLKLSQEDWPKEKVKDSDVDQEMLELKPEVIYQIKTVDPVVEFRRYSSWWKLLRVVAYVFRFVHKCMKMKIDGPLTPVELDQAEVQIIKWIQQESYPVEYAQLSDKKPVHSSSSIYELSPVLQDGLMKMSGRTTKSKTLTKEAQNQLILSSKHPVTKLLIHHYHVKFHHQGQETVLNEIRQKYWIPGARTAVRKVFNDCLICRLLRPKPVIQEMGQLPASRVTRQVRPFMETGLDYFGPVEVTIGRRVEKRWVALFTCMTVRAVHLELAHHLNTDSAIMAVRRFADRRGTPTSINCDNGTNFHGADSELKKALAELDQERIVNELSKRGITWKFIPPSAPHMGGAWERMVKSVKNCLRATLKMKKPPEEVLVTALAEVENVVNSRPITYVSSDPKDPEALTPNHFLIGPACEVSIPSSTTDKDLIARQLWKRSQAIADEFWRKWTKDYLPTLNRRGKWHGAKGSVAVGDIVFIVDGDQPRGTWPKGIITQLFPGKDGKVRVVEIKTQDGIFKRHIAKILTTGFGNC